MPEQIEPVDWVDPLIDSANRRYFFFTSASHPFGLVNLSPDTVPVGAWDGGYRYDEPHICWFSHIHAWQVAALPVLPFTGEVRGHLGVENYRSGFAHENEVVEPGFHSVFLDDYEIKAELTSTVRVGYHRYTFPTDEEPGILLDLTAEIGPTEISDASFRRISDTEFTGYIENGATRRRPKAVKVYFNIHVNTPGARLGGWRDGKLLEGVNESITGSTCGAFLQWPMGSVQEPVVMKVAISYCSEDSARANYEAEAKNLDFNGARIQAREEWNRQLGRIRVQGGTDRQTTKFYTDLFHSIKGRRRVCDVDGSYCDLTGDSALVRHVAADEHGKPTYEHHTTDAFWGSWWTFNTLWPLVYPEKITDFANTLVSMYQNCGVLPRENVGGMMDYVMIGAHSTPFLVQAFQKGMGDFDPETVYQGLRKNHFPGGLMGKAGYEYKTAIGGGVESYIDDGFVHYGIKAEAFHCDGASQTLEYSFEDWCLAQMAKALGKTGDYGMFMARSENYKNIWNIQNGFFQPRKSDGSWLTPFDPMEPDGWCEANGYHYLWWVPHDVQSLIRMMGGREKFAARLDRQFEDAKNDGYTAPHASHHVGVMDYGNQPSTHLAHLFNHSGAPWLTQKWVREVMDVAKSDVTPYGGYGGDEDQGQMGSLNVLMAIGLFQMRGGCESDPVYEITSPIFDKVTVTLDPVHYGNAANPAPVLRIETENNSAGNIYIQSAKLNGAGLDRAWFRHSDLVGGAHLYLVLGPEPNKNWASSPDCAPPSGEAE